LKAPTFNQKINLPKASTDPTSKQYLESRQVDSDKFYYAKNSKNGLNSLKLHLMIQDMMNQELSSLCSMNQNLNWSSRTQFKLSDNPKSVKYITVMFNDDCTKNLWS
jgi:hypothetical protein